MDKYNYSIIGNCHILLIFAILIFLPLTAHAAPFIIDQSDQTFHCYATSELDTVPDLDVSIIRYEISLEFDFDNENFAGDERVIFQNTSSGSINTIELDAANGILDFYSVTDDNNHPLDFSHINDVLTVWLANPLDSGAQSSINIEFSGTDQTIDGPFGSMGLWISDNRAWTFCFPDGLHAIAPVIDNPAVKAEVYWSFGVPEGLTAVANGHLVSETTENGITWFNWQHNHPVCTSEMGFAIADYHIVELQTDPFPIRYYVYQNHIAAAEFDFARIPECIELYNDAFACDYPFEELKVIECGVFGGWGGQEHQTMISLGNQMITGTRQYENILMHEIAHQWFADYLTPVHWEHFWLNEGFAVWSEAVWAQHLGDWDDYLSEIRSDRNAYFAWESSNHNQALVNTDYDETMNSALPYERGALAIHQLLMRYGEEQFESALSDYFDAYGFGHVCTDELCNTFINTTGDENLHTWFDEWVLRGEAPVIQYAYDEENNIVYLRQVFDHANSPEHGELYNCMQVSFGEPDNFQVADWPAGNASMTFELDDWGGNIPDDPQLFPNLEVPARFYELDDIESPIISIQSRLSGEDVLPDNVLQPNENATITFEISNDGLPIENATIELTAQIAGIVDIPEPTQTGVNIEFLQSDAETIEFDIVGNVAYLPDYTPMNLSISNDIYDIDLEFGLAVGEFAEILLLEDGVEGAIDSLSKIIEEADIVWGTPNIPYTSLPSDMFGALAIMIEVDGRYSEYLFTENDDSLRVYCTTIGSSVISGEYIHEIYPNASTWWLGGISGTWTDPVNGPAFFGIEDNEVSDGRDVVALGQNGTSECGSCCGGPSIFLAADDSPAAALWDFDRRLVNYGFALRSLMNAAPATMTRDDLISRTANFITFRTNSIVGEQETELPGEFTLKSYPNPFNPSLNMSVYLPQKGNLNIEIFDILGRKVTTLVDSQFTAGKHQFTWNASNNASGIYLVRAKTGSNTLVNKVSLVR